MKKFFRVLTALSHITALLHSSASADSSASEAEVPWTTLQEYLEYVNREGILDFLRLHGGMNIRLFR